MLRRTRTGVERGNRKLAYLERIGRAPRFASFRFDEFLRWDWLVLGGWGTEGTSANLYTGEEESREDTATAPSGVGPSGERRLRRGVRPHHAISWKKPEAAAERSRRWRRLLRGRWPLRVTEDDWTRLTPLLYRSLPLPRLTCWELLAAHNSTLFVGSPLFCKMIKHEYACSFYIHESYTLALYIGYSTKAAHTKFGLWWLYNSWCWWSRLFFHSFLYFFVVVCFIQAEVRRLFQDLSHQYNVLES